MATRKWFFDMAIAVLAAVAIGVALGLGAGFVARSLDWPTGFVGPLTGGVVGALVVAFYQVRAKRGDGAA